MSSTKESVPEVVVLFLAAGMSSRFGGRIKSLERVGVNGESLLELSMNEAKNGGVNRIIIAVSPRTREEIERRIGRSHNGLRVEYCIQDTPPNRKKPYGTAHTIISAIPLISPQERIIIANSDDIYGPRAWELIVKELKNNPKGYCIAGFRLKNVLPDNESEVNRGMIKTDEEGNLLSIEERLGISRRCIDEGIYTGEELASTNLFGVHKAFLEYCKDKFSAFEALHETDNKEFFLPEELSAFAKEKNQKIKVIPTEDVILGLTYPQDVPGIIQNLRARNI